MAETSTAPASSSLSSWQGDRWFSSGVVSSHARGERPGDGTGRSEGQRQAPATCVVWHGERNCLQRRVESGTTTHKE